MLGCSTLLVRSLMQTKGPLSAKGEISKVMVSKQQQQQQFLLLERKARKNEVASFLQSPVAVVLPHFSLLVTAFSCSKLN